MIYELLTQEEVDAIEGPKHVWADMDVFRVYTGEDMPPAPAAPNVVSMRQARLALLGAGMLETVNAAIAAMAGVEGEAARIEWEYAAEVERYSPLVAGMGAALNLASEQLDQLFITAATL